MLMLTNITITYDRTEEDQLVRFNEDTKTYSLTKYQKTNQSTTINLRPIVKKGEKVNKRSSTL